MTVLGIDPSLTATGIAWEGGLLTAHTTAKQTHGDRLDLIYRRVRSCTNAQTTLAVVEDLPTHAHGAGLTGMAQGVVRLALAHDEVPMLVVTAASLKTFATGKGNAGKADMRMELYKRAGLDIADDNQVDAWWLRALGLHVLGAPLLTLPASHTRALSKVTLPGGITQPERNTP